MPDQVVTTQWLSSRESPYDLHQQPVVSFTIAAIIGILAERFGELGPVSWMITVSLVLLLVIQFRAADRRQLGWILLLVGVAIACGFYSHSRASHYDSSALLQIATHDPQPCVIRARIRHDLQIYEAIAPDFEQSRSDNAPLVTTTTWRTQFSADVSEMRQSDRWSAIHGGIKVIVDAACHSLAPGDLVELSGELAALKPSTNPGESDLRVQARNRHVHANVVVDSEANLQLVKAGPWSLSRFSYRAGQRGEQVLRGALTEQTLPMASALVLGRRTSLDPERKDQLLETGTIHLLSVSGLHMGVVAVTMIWLSTMLNLGRWSQAVLVLMASILFASVTGANPPVMRAALLVGTLLVAQWAMRRHMFLNSLSFAALVLLVLNPTHVQQVGVQLSFLSVAALSLAARGAAARDVNQRLQDESSAAKIEALVQQTRSPWMRRVVGLKNHCNQYLWYSACVTLVTTPLTWLHFNVISFISVIANLLLTIPASFALIAGLLTILLGGLWKPLGYLPALACDLALRWVLWLVEWLSAIPLSHAWLPKVPAWWVAVFYVLLVAAIVFLKTHRSRRYFIAGSLAWIAVGYVLAILPSLRSRDAVQATFVDVSHGTSVLIELPGGANVLYDCGRLGNYLSSSRGIQDVLWNRGITRLDAVVLSHADSDHYNALPGLIHRFSIDEVIVPPGLFNQTDPALVEIRQMLNRQRIPIREVAASEPFAQDCWSLDKVKMQVLHPPRPPIAGATDNANSLCLLIQYRQQRLLLPGDLEPPGTEMLIAQSRPVAGGVLMAPHHGSLTANSEAMLDWFRPRHVIVSGGPRARNPRVTELLQYRGSEIYITAKDGAIRVRLADDVEVQCYLRESW